MSTRFLALLSLMFVLSGCTIQCSSGKQRTRINFVESEYPDAIAYHAIRESYSGEVILFVYENKSLAFHEDCNIIISLFDVEKFNHGVLVDGKQVDVDSVAVEGDPDKTLKILRDDGLNVVVCKRVTGYELKYKRNTKKEN